MQALRAILTAIAASTMYLVATLATPVIMSTTAPATGAVSPFLSVAQAAPASTQSNPNTSGNSLQNPPGSGGFGNSAATNNLTAPDPSSTSSSGSSSNSGNDQNAVDQDSCAQKDGAFSWIFCPFFDGVSHTFADGAKDLISNFLAVQPLQQSGPIYDTWNNIRLLADTLFVLIFLVIIFANTLQFDLNSYTIKRMIPKLVASAILVQFSFILVSVIVDAGNVLGAGIGQLIGSTIQGGQTSSVDAGALSLNLLGGGILVALATVAWEMAFPLALMVLITVLATILTLALRYVILGVLIIISPLAFAAWVLPNTERYFSTWLNTLIKLVLMYPIIIALLSLAANVDKLVPAAASASTAPATSLTTTIIKVLVFVACFAAIPQTFKWAGGAMAQGHNAIDGLRKWGHKEVRESDNWKNKRARTSSRQIERANQMGAALQPMLGSRNPLMKLAGGGMFTAGSILLAGRTGTSVAGRQRGSSQLVNKIDKELQELREASPSNLKHVLMAHYGSKTQRDKALGALQQQGAEYLTEYSRRIEGRQALVRRLADKNLLGSEVMGTVQSHSRAFQRPEELQMVLRENGKNIRDNPMMFARHDRSDPSKTNIVGNPVRIGDVNRDAASGFISSLTAARFGSDFAMDNLKLMTANKAGATQETVDMAHQVSTLMGEKFSPAVAHQIFNAHGQAFGRIGTDKRVALLEGMARNEAEFQSSPQGQQVWSTIVNQINSNMARDPASHADALRLLDDTDPTLRSILGI